MTNRKQRGRFGKENRFPGTLPSHSRFGEYILKPAGQFLCLPGKSVCIVYRFHAGEGPGSSGRPSNLGGPVNVNQLSNANLCQVRCMIDESRVLCCVVGGGTQRCRNTRKNVRKDSITHKKHPLRRHPGGLSLTPPRQAAVMHPLNGCLVRIHTRGSKVPHRTTVAVVVQQPSYR